MSSFLKSLRMPDRGGLLLVEMHGITVKRKFK